MTEPTLEQLQQQVAEKEETIKTLTTENASFKEKLEKGELVSPKDAISKAVTSGDMFSKDRYVGLQHKFEEEQTARKKAEEDLGLLKTELTGLNAEKGTISSEVEQLKTTVGEKDATISKLESDLGVANLIFKDFPELAGWKEFLPSGTMEELPEKFKAFSEKLGTMKKAGAEEFAAGGGTSTPSGKGGKAQSKSKDFLNAATQAALKGDSAAYQENYDKYLEALKAEDNK